MVFARLWVFQNVAFPDMRHQKQAPRRLGSEKMPKRGGVAERHGWRLFLHPAFRDIFDRLVAEVADLERARPGNYHLHPRAKLLRRIVDLILNEIPSDPASPKYRQGKTLGGAHRHWRRAKFLGRFRLFLRYSEKDKIIIYAWINDENTLRKAGRGAIRTRSSGSGSVAAILRTVGTLW
jgi:toxin YhaV